MGLAIVFLGGLPNKWVFVFAMAGIFPLFILFVGSTRKAFHALLVFSLSAVIDVHLGFSDEYAQIRPGIPIALTSLCLLAVFVLGAVQRGNKNGFSVCLRPSIVIPFVIIVVWSGLSVFVAPYPGYVWTRLPGVAAGFFMFIYAVNLVKSVEDTRFLMKCIAAMVMVGSMVGIAEYATDTSFGLVFLGGRDEILVQPYEFTRITRASGLFRHANELAEFLNGVLPVLCLWALASRRTGIRVLCSFAFVAGLVALVLTYSRGGWLAFAVSIPALAFFYFLAKRKDPNRGSLKRLIALGLLAVALIAPFFSPIMTRLTKDDYGAAVSRVPLAMTALRSIAEKPFTGVGLGNYQPAVAAYDPDPVLDENGNPLGVHNMFLLIAAEIGVPAVLLFVWISMNFFTRGMATVFRPDGEQRLFAVGVLSGLTALYVHTMFENVFLGHQTYVLLCFMGGSLVGLRELDLRMGLRH